MMREQKDYSLGGKCTCGSMLSNEGMTRVIHWHGAYKEEVERGLGIWSKAWDVQIEKIDEHDGRSGRTPDVLLQWGHPQGTVVVAEIKEIVIPFCSFRSDDGQVTVEICRENVTTSLKQEAKRVRNKIGRAAKQLQVAAREGYPTLLVVGYWTPMLDQFLDFEIAWAMKGGEHRIRIATEGVSYDLVGPETGGRKLWGDVNRSISGVGRVMGPWHGLDHQVPKLRVFPHNQPKVQIPRGLPGVEFMNV